jgi:uncharacterized protein (DUF1697 family)
MKFIALFRGINVGGKNKLPMKDLIEMFRELGCEDVACYIQSGNIIFKAPADLARRVPILVAKEIQGAFSLTVPVVLRSSKELGEVSRNNPFLKTVSERDRLHVAFLAALPSPTKVSSLDPKRSPPDRFVLRGREIYLSLPNGVAKTKLTNAYFDSRLATVSTLRNWNTVQKLIELAQ